MERLHRLSLCFKQDQIHEARWHLSLYRPFVYQADMYEGGLESNHECTVCCSRFQTYPLSDLPSALLIAAAYLLFVAVGSVSAPLACLC